MQEAQRENRKKVVEYLSVWDGRGNEVDIYDFVEDNIYSHELFITRKHLNTLSTLLEERRVERLSLVSLSWVCLS